MSRPAMTARLAGGIQIEVDADGTTQLNGHRVNTKDPETVINLLALVARLMAVAND